MNIHRLIKNNFKIIITIIILLILFLIYFRNNSNFIFQNNSKLLADVTPNKVGYTCDRFSGLCEIDTIAAEYTSETSCQKSCSVSRYKWYCNKTLGQCNRDFRGTYNNLETCWKNCYAQVSYYCDIRDGLCKSGIIYGAEDRISYLQFATMTLDECSQKCRPVTRAYLYDSNTQKCTWANPENGSKNLIDWNECISKTKTDNQIRYSLQPAYANDQSSYAVENKLSQVIGFNPYKLGKIIYIDNTSYSNKAYACFPTPTGEYTSYSSCLQNLNNGFDQYKDYSGFNCDYEKGQCILVKNNAEFQAPTLEDAQQNCFDNCNPVLDSIIQCNSSATSNNSEKIIEDPKLHACYIKQLTPIPSTNICYNNSDCKVFNNWICAHKDTANLSKLVFSAITSDTCKKNEWKWIGKVEQSCICRAGSCQVNSNPLPGVNQDPRCKDGTCDELEKYKYLHSGDYKDPNGSSNYSSPSFVENQLYCPSDCN